MSTAEQTQQYFEKEAADFDAAYGGSPRQIKDFIRRISYIYNKKPIEGRLNALLDLVGPAQGKRIFEAGCGPGFYSIRLAERGAQVTALDYAEGMIEIAKRNAEKAGVRLNFLVGDINDLSVADQFDVTFATGVAEYIPPAKQLDFLKKMAALSREYVIISFPRKGILHAFIRNLWLSNFKKVKITFFDNEAIACLSGQVGLRESDRRDVGILWVVKFVKVSS